MYKPNNKKMLTVLISIAMIFSALAILSFAATPAYAQSASGTFYAGVNPADAASSNLAGGTILTPLASPAPMIFLSHDTEVFTAGQTVDFYWSTSATASGIVGGSVGTTTASAGGLIGGAFVLTGVPSTAGNYYLVAASEGDTSAGIAASTTTFTIATESSYPTSLTLSLTQSSGYSTNVTGTHGLTIYYEGSGFEATSSTVTLALAYYSNGTVLPSASVTFSSDSVTSSGELSGSFTIPMVYGAAFYVIAYDSGTSGGKATAQAFLIVKASVSPVISVPVSLTQFSTVTLTGYSFPSTATFAASTTASPSDTLTIDGVDAILSSAPTVSSTNHGKVTFSITGLVSGLSTTGPQTVVITDQQGQTFTFTDQAYVSSTSATPTLVVTDTTTNTNSGNVGDTIDVVLYNALGSDYININFGSYSLASSAQTSSIGFYSNEFTVPTLPGGTYTVSAMISSAASSSVSVEYATASFTIAPLVTLDFNGYYLGVGATVYVNGTGLAPNTEYAVTDTGYVSDGGTGNVVYDNLVGDITGAQVNVVVTGEISPNEMGVNTTSAGSFVVKYTIEYFGLATGANQTVTVSGGSITSQTQYYYAVGSVSVTASSASYNPSTSPAQTVTLTLSGLVPSGASVQGASVTYSLATTLYTNGVGSTPAAVDVYANGATSTSSTFSSSSATSGSATLTFSSSSLTAGLNDIQVVYSSVTIPSLTSSDVLGYTYLVVSTPSTSSSNWEVTYVSEAGSPGTAVNYYLYDLPASSTVTYYYYTISGNQSSSFSTDANGAANLSLTLPFAPAGSYQLTFIASGTRLTAHPAFTVEATLSSVPSTSSSYPSVGSTSVTLYPNQQVTLYAYGLSPNTYYGIYADTATSGSALPTALATFTTDSTGSYSSGVMVTVPSTVSSGATNYLNVVAPTSGSWTAVAYYTFTAGTYNNIFGPTFNYSTNTEYAFPGQLVNFAWVLPSTNHPSAPGASDGPVYVTVLLNGTSYTTLPANLTVSGTVYTLSGSFLMPNNNTGAYWTLTLEWYQTTSAGYTSYLMPTTGAPTLALVSGNGALVINLNTATLTAIIQTAVGQAMKVPLSELNATIVSLDNTTAVLKTTVGTMSTTLSTINATVASIESGQVLVQTDLGSIMTSFASLNSSIQKFSGEVATISTTLGNVTTSLSSINTQVVSNGGKLVTVETALGNINGTIVATHGQTSQISTALGDLNATVSKINTNTQGFGTLEVFLIVIVVLVLITLVLSFMAVTAANKASRKVSEEKKQ